MDRADDIVRFGREKPKSMRSPSIGFTLVPPVPFQVIQIPAKQASGRSQRTRTRPLRSDEREWSWSRSPFDFSEGFAPAIAA
jgi:hypothetical protein